MKINCDWKIKILTPVHIGGAQEKHWQEGLDFIIKDRKVYFLNQEKMINHWGIDRYSDFLASGKIKELIKNIKIEDFSDRVEPISGKTEEIRQHIKNAASGKPIIPGSSLKGALRSVIFKYLIDQSHHSINGKNAESKIFGKISEDFMRFIQVGDVEFERTEILNTKILSLNERKNLGWKNRRKGSEANLNEKYFTTGYECIAPNQYTTAKIKFDLEGYRRAENIVHTPKGLENLFSAQFEETLFNIINEHSRSYFKKELGYFDRYVQFGSDAEYIEQAKADIVSLKNDLFAKQRASLRVAAGSGFHSITGDWQFKDHLIDKIGDRNRGMRNGKESAKTRKLSFQHSKEKKRYSFSPMGYIQFLTEEDYNENIAPAVEARKSRILEEKRRAAEEERKKQEEEKRKAEEAKKPKMTPKEKIKKDFKYVDIEVLEWKFRNLKVKPYVEGFQETIYKLKLPNPVEKGTILKLKMKLIAKGKKLQHEGRPIPKER